MGIPDRRHPPPTVGSPLSFINATSNNPSSGPALNLEFDSTMVDNLRDLFLGRTTRFFGKYSGVMVHQATLQLKRDCITSSPGSFIADFPPSLLVSNMELLLKMLIIMFFIQHTPDLPHSTPHSFPEHDLMQSLIELYFTHQNILFPLLHRPTIEKCVAHGLHLSNGLFAEKILLVCAIGSRYSDDPRVLLDDEPAPLSRGWKWFSQVQVSRDLLIKIPTTDGMQFCCVSIHSIMCQHLSLIVFPASGNVLAWDNYISSFLEVCWFGSPYSARYGCSSPQSSQLCPICQRRVNEACILVCKPFNVDEKDISNCIPYRTLLLMDRLLSAMVGRPCAIQDEEFVQMFL